MAKRRRMKRQRGRGHKGRRRSRRQRGRGFKEIKAKFLTLGKKFKDKMLKGVHAFRKSSAGKKILSNVLDKAVDVGLRKGKITNPIATGLIVPRAKDMILSRLTS